MKFTKILRIYHSDGKPVNYECQLISKDGTYYLEPIAESDEDFDMEMTYAEYHNMANLEWGLPVKLEDL